jgi:hypothetical protein
MVCQLGNHSVDGVLYSSKLRPHVSSIEVVVDSFEPSDIVMRVGDKMDGECRAIGGVGFMVMLFHHLFIVESEPS